MYITHAMLAKKVNPEQLIFFHHYYLFYFYVRKAVNWLKTLTHAQKVVLIKGTIPQNVKRTSLKMSAKTSCTQSIVNAPILTIVRGS